MTEPVPVLLMSFSLGIGGSERQLTEVAKALDRERFQVHVGCFHPEGIRGEELRARGIPILHLPVTSFASVSALRGAWQLWRYIARHRIKLVHTFDVPLNIFGVPVARFAFGPKVLSSQRAHRLLTPGGYHRLLRFSDRLVNGIVVNCEFMRRHLIEDEKVRPELIHLCYNSLDTSVFRRRDGTSINGATVVIGVVCALRPEKGLPTLVEAFARVLPEEPGAKLLFAGSGPCLDDLQKRARSLGVLEACVFVPTNNEVPKWLSAIDIFVLPSLSEALSNSLMEAMACGCCVVASNVGGNPELVGNSERGLLFEAGDAVGLATVLTGLIRNPERRRVYSGAAGEFISRQFSVTASINRMQEIYTCILSDSCSPR